MKWVLVVLMVECCAPGNIRVAVHDNEKNCRESEEITGLQRAARRTSAYNALGF